MHVRQISFFDRRRPPPERADGLLAAAAPLLADIGTLRLRPSSLNQDAPTAALDHGLTEFVQRARQSGISADSIAAAESVLRLLIAESLLLHPAVGEANQPPWKALVSGGFDREAFGAFMVHQFHRSRRDHDMLRFLNTTVLLGLEDSLSSAQTSSAEMKQLVTGLSAVVERRSGGTEKGISSHWQAAPSARVPLQSRLPIWVALSMAGLLLLAGYYGTQALREGMFNAVIVDAEFIARPPL